MKRKYEFQTKTEGLTLQVEESGCPDTVTLSLLYRRQEIVEMSLTRSDWDTLRSISSSYGSEKFEWTPTTGNDDDGGSRDRVPDQDRAESPPDVRWLNILRAIPVVAREDFGPGKSFQDGVFAYFIPDDMPDGVTLPFVREIGGNNYFVHAGPGRNFNTWRLPVHIIEVRQND